MSNARFTADGIGVIFSSNEAYTSGDTNLESDVYLKRPAEATQRLSITPEGTEPNGLSVLVYNAA